MITTLGAALIRVAIKDARKAWAAASDAADAGFKAGQMSWDTREDCKKALAPPLEHPDYLRAYMHTLRRMPPIMVHGRDCKHGGKAHD